MAHEESEIKKLVNRDRAVVLFVLSSVALCAWLYMLNMSPGIGGIITGESSPCMMQWGLTDVFLLFVMWSVMMMAMMLPSAMPMFLMFASVHRLRMDCRDPIKINTAFISGYIFVWIVYSAAATMAQWGFHAASMMSHTMVITSPLVGGVLLITAGVFQWTPFRDSCMTKCRSPLGFFMTEWRKGKRGALIMGLRFGVFCVGCCWLLMTLSLVLGVMNLLWMAALTVYMVVERSSVGGKWLSRAAGLVFIVWGFVVIVGQRSHC